MFTGMNRTGLVAAVEMRCSELDMLSSRQRRALVSSIVSALLDEIVAATRSGHTVNIHSFGRFVPRVRAAGTKKNPRTGEDVFVPERLTVAFLPSDVYKESLNTH